MKKIILLLISTVSSLSFFCPNCYAGPPDRYFDWWCESKKLIKLVNQYNGPSYQKWKEIARLMGNKRSVGAYRAKYLNYLDPNVNRSPWTPEEDELLIQKVNELGYKWAKISKFLDRRKGDSIRNRYKLLLRKKKKHVEPPAQLPDIETPDIEAFYKITNLIN